MVFAVELLFLLLLVVVVICIARQNEKEKRENQYVQWACVGVWVIVRIARATLGTWSEPKNPAIAH